ncbi:hypothetical protein AVEN_189098-1 [Araneus ventricosus]|uniref:Uncharacterized protein n=1 Tax=Araneus ventricosus TaxID=182803 RepID=A0A4Y2HG44_ARAVE|nr:hypothetical protein AVEN_189098-1 [Araneus ventricosus]
MAGGICKSEYATNAELKHSLSRDASKLCSCGEIGIRIHYATSCLLTTSWHMKLPKPSLEQEWYRRVASNHLSRGRILELSISFIITRSFLRQTSSNPVKPPIPQLLNQGSGRVFFPLVNLSLRHQPFRQQAIQ